MDMSGGTDQKTSDMLVSYVSEVAGAVVLRRNEL